MLSRKIVIVSFIITAIGCSNNIEENTEQIWGLKKRPDRRVSIPRDGGVSDQRKVDTLKPDQIVPTVAHLIDLWNNKAHFIVDQSPVPVPVNTTNLSYFGHREVFPVARPDIGTGVIYYYQRCFENGLPEICLAISYDNGQTMGKDFGVVVRHGPGETCVAAAAVVKLGNEWVMVYEAYNIGTLWASSSDGITWSHKGLLLPPRYFACTPSLFVENGIVYVFTATVDMTAPTPGQLRIMLHSGPSMTQLVPRGFVLTWGVGWDAGNVSMPRVVKQDNYYWMIYEGGTIDLWCGWTTEERNDYGIGIARSTNLINWEKWSGNPILQGENMESCGFDMPQPFLNPYDGSYYFYYPFDQPDYVVRDKLVFGSACGSDQVYPDWREKNHICLPSCSFQGGTCSQSKFCSTGVRTTSWDCASCCK